MNKYDLTYLNLLRNIVNSGVEKDTRAGRVKSVFGRQIRFNLKEGFPLLTTKKVFTKGIIHELLWFLQRPQNSHGSMNIEYLVRNGVHIWDDDAYRWFKKTIAKEFKPKQYMVCVNDDEKSKLNKADFEYWIENDVRINDADWLQNITKEEFLDLTLQKVEIWGSFMSRYRFGDLGPIYGKQWRCFSGFEHVDQIANIIETLRTNPNDRRMVCIAYNPDKVEDMALPPCHVMFQFYTRELTIYERLEEFRKRCNGNGDCIEEYEKAINPWLRKDKEETMKRLDESGVPKYGLSCMWTQRSCDCPCGIPFNIASYALLTYMIAHLVDMVPDELIGSLGDCHIYLNQMEGVNEQLERNGSNILPQLKINRKVDRIEDFKFEDFEVTDYEPDPPIKYPLNVG
jgi:thymidylate synthase